MKKIFSVLGAIALMSTLPLESARKDTIYRISHNNKKYTLTQQSASIGQLGDGTWTKLVCMKKGAIGRPNTTTSDYRGTYINKDKQRCYVFALKPEGSIVFENKTFQVYVGNDGEGVFDDGTPIRTMCIDPHTQLRLKYDPNYRGKYYTPEKQCLVYVKE